MSKCRQCQVIVRDDTQICPLCNCVLDTDDQVENKYPDIWAKNHVLKLLIRIYLFVAIVTEGVLVALNYIYFDGLYWSVIVGVILAYIYMTLAYTVSYSSAGYRRKIIVGVAGAGLLLFRRNWQSYLSFEIAMIFFSLIPVILSWEGVIQVRQLSYMALAAAVCMFLGTVIIGGRRATTELKRRFHIK